jgi:hypothetical protein
VRERLVTLLSGGDPSGLECRQCGWLVIVGRGAFARILRVHLTLKMCNAWGLLPCLSAGTEYVGQAAAKRVVQQSVLQPYSREAEPPLEAVWRKGPVAPTALHTVKLAKDFVDVHDGAALQHQVH